MKNDRVESYIKAQRVFNNLTTTLLGKNASESIPTTEICEFIDNLEKRGIEVKVVTTPDQFMDGERRIIKTFKIGRNYPLELPDDTKVFYFYMWYRYHSDSEHSVIRFDTDVELMWPPKVHRVYLYERAVEGKINKRIDIKALLKNPIEKAKLIARSVKASRFFK